jgi:flavodoxin
LAKALVVYYTVFGNTEKLANALAAGLRSSGVEVEVSKVDVVKFEELTQVDLLCVGSPVHAWSDSKPVKDLLEHLKSVDDLKGKKAFAFDTKMSHSRLAGSATGKIESKLKALGLIIVKPGESAVVKGREGPLEEGAEERFNKIGVELAKTI